MATTMLQGAPAPTRTRKTGWTAPRSGLLVAATGGPTTPALVRTAATLARAGEPLSLLGVVPPMDAYVMGPMGDLPVTWVQDERRDTVLRALRTAVRDA